MVRPLFTLSRDGRKQSLLIPSKNFSFGQNPEFIGKLLGP
jgi:hypothetical protein